MSAVDPTADDVVPVVTPRAVDVRTSVTWTALALMTVSSVASLRPAPTMALYGLGGVFLYVLPAIIFLVPTALVSAELASGWSGGVFRFNLSVGGEFYRRAVIADRRVAAGILAVVKAHCPDKVPTLQQFLDQRFDTVVRG